MVGVTGRSVLVANEAGLTVEAMVLVPKEAVLVPNEAILVAEEGGVVRD